MTPPKAALFLCLLIRVRACEGGRYPEPAAAWEPGKPMKILASLLAVFFKYEAQASKLLLFTPAHISLL
jgi:hypothetical protein